MSFNITINASLTTMMTAQYATSVASANIANADTAGYTAKSASNQAQIVGGQAVGVQTGSLTSSIDARLLENLINSASTAGYSNSLSGYYNSLDQAFGSISGDNTLSELITEIESALATLAVDPTSSSSQYDAVTAFSNLAGSLSGLSRDIQDMRADADQAIEDTVNRINELLEELDQLNDSITELSAQGSNTADLEDARNTALLELSGYMEISYFTDSNNRVNVYSQGGTALVTSNDHPLSYEATTTVSSSTVYPTHFDAISVGGKDITGEITSGELGALIDLRDDTLPQLQEELDMLASSLISSVNEIANKGSSYPAPNSLTGVESVTAADAFSGTGIVRVAVTDSDGTVQDFADIDLSTMSTVQDVIDAVNLIPGASASINADGVLEISASSGSEGIAINEMTSSVGAGSEGFSSYFGLNDIFTGSDASTITLNPNLAGDASRFPSGRLSDDAGLVAGDLGLTSGDVENTEALVNLFESDQSFSAAGGTWRQIRQLRRLWSNNPGPAQQRCFRCQ